MSMPHVVILGAGFAGLNAARGLARARVRVTVIDRSNHHLFQPLLYQIATAGLSPADIAVPVRSVLRRSPRTEVRMADVTGLDLAGRRAHTDQGDVPYDYLIVATGATHSYFGHDEWSEVAPGLKSIADATRIRRRILTAFERAETETDPARRRELLTFVMVGGGPTGVEMSGAIAELAHRSLRKDFRRIDPDSARVILVEAGPRLLAAFPERLAAAARRELERLGVEVRTGSRVEAIDEHGVVAGSERLQAATVVWTAGVKASPIAAALGGALDRAGRIVVRPDLSIDGHPEVFAAGDIAACTQDGQPLPGVAPVAIQQGRYLARLIAARAASADGASAPETRTGRRGEPAFRYLDKGNLATVGRAFAIADVRGLHVSGFVAWLLWVVVHVLYLIGFRNRALVLAEWAWAYFSFSRGARLIVS